MNSKIISFAVGGIILAGLIFYAGIWYGKKQIVVNGNRGLNGFSSQNFNMMNGSGARGVMRGGANGFIGGEIISKDEKSITVKLRDGGSKIIFLSDSTKVLKSVAGSSLDLAVGEQVTVIGTPSTDGSIVAESLQIRPITEAPKAQ